MTGYYEYIPLPNSPQVDPVIFWDWDCDKMDFQAAYKPVIRRIIQYAPEWQWPKMVEFYGEERIKHALLNEIVSMWKEAIPKAAAYFNINPEEMPSYKRHIENPDIYKRWMR